MKEIFTDLYRKLAGFFQATEKENKEDDGSKNVATNRLKFVLMQDRTNLTPYLLERMRSEMIDVLSRYVEMDKDALELSFEQEGESMALMLSIPVIRAKDEEEIQAIIDAEEKAKREKEKEEAIEEESEEKVEETEESEEETEDAFKEDATKTVDVESELEEEEVCTCDDDDDDDEEDDESDDVELEYVEEITPTKKSKKK